MRITKSYRDKWFEYYVNAPEGMSEFEREKYATEQATDYFEGYADYLLDLEKDKRMEE